MKNLNRIQTFVLVVEKNGITPAAKHLGISPAAVSKQIKELEKELNIQLLTRTTRRIQLTQEGELYYSHCQKILEQLNEAESLISQLHKEPTGNLRILSGPHFANHYIFPHLREFMMKFPKITIDLELAQRMPNLAKENIDIVIGLSLPGLPDYIGRKVITTRDVLCASPSYLKHYDSPNKPKDLVNHHFITHSQRHPDNLLTFKNGEEIRLPPLLRLNDTRAMRECAVKGLGFIRVHEYVVSNSLDKGELVEILSEYMEPKKTIPIYLYYAKSEFLHSKIRTFIDFILKKCQ